MKKILFIGLLLTSTSIFAQWSSYESKALADSFATRDISVEYLLNKVDTLTDAISDIEISGQIPLQYGKILIGDIDNNANPRTISGPIAIGPTGITSVVDGSLVDADISASALINPSKISSTGLVITPSMFAALYGINSNIQEQIDGFITQEGLVQNGAQNDLEISWTVIDGSQYGILFGEDNQVNFPTLTDVSNLDPGKYGMKGDTAYIGTNHGTEKMLLEYQVDAKLDSLVKYGEADIKQQELDTLDFSSVKVVDSWFGREDGPQTVEIINYTAKTISFFVQSLEGVTFDFNGKTDYYLDRIGLPAFTDGKAYLVTMIYSRNGVYVSYGEYGTAL